MKIFWVTGKIGLSGLIDDYNALGRIDIVINCRAEAHDDLDILSQKRISYFWLPITDYLAPTYDMIHTFLDIVEMNKEKGILIHCRIGRGRSATLIVAYLMKELDFSLEEAIDHLKKIKPDVSLTKLQFDKLKGLVIK